MLHFKDVKDQAKDNFSFLELWYENQRTVFGNNFSCNFGLLET